MSLCLFSCDTDVDVSNIPYEPKIVIEGSIENGDYASVLISVTAPVTGVLDTVSLLNHTVRNAKVTVSSADTFEVLYLRSNRDRLPPYEYRGKLIKGEIGKHYSLKVEYDGKIITSTTYIPAPVALDNIWFKQRSENDSLGYIGVSFKNESTEYYQLATSSFWDRDIFTPCLLGNIDSRKYEPGAQINIELYKGPNIYSKFDFNTSFHISDVIRIKFSTQPKAAYDYWVSYQKEVLNSQNPIYPAFSSLTTNISGGIGIWSGYGSQQYIVILSKIEKVYE